MKLKFRKGQVVQLKNIEELKQENLKLYYRIDEDNLYNMANAQVAVYKILGKRQLHSNGEPINWYVIGQWGRNIIEVPETFLIKKQGGGQ